MKSLLLILLTLVSLLLTITCASLLIKGVSSIITIVASAEENKIKVEESVNTNKILYILISVERTSLDASPVATVITNYYSNARNEFNKTNLNEIKRLETEIKLREKRFHELYDGLPEKYIGDGSTISSNQLDRLQALWYGKNRDKVEIDVKKKELEKLKGNK